MWRISLGNLDDRPRHACSCNTLAQRPFRRLEPQRYAGCVLLCQGQE